MKQISIIVSLLIFPILAKAQDVSVENRLYGVHTGIYGLWGYADFKLAPKTALRAELGFDMSFWGGSNYSENGYALIPTMTVEPRWYYNLKKRQLKGKRIDGNSANYFSIAVKYYPGFFLISNYPQAEAVSDWLMIPSWGIRRNIGQHFAYEVGPGIIVGRPYDYLIETLYLHLRIGYRF